MSKLAERMRFVLDRKWVKNARRWALDADVSDKQVSTYLDRADADPDADIQTSVAVALAKAAKVSVTWFVSGEGEPRREEPSRDPTGEFVRARLREIARRGSTIGEMAEELHLTPIVVRRIWGGDGVPERQGEAVARALGFTSTEAIKGAASDIVRAR
jgi:hypothetical protein